jgi:hypothetical protein
VLATIEAKWNLPALTYRDANAAPVWDLLDFSAPAFPNPPKLKRPRGMLRELIIDLFRQATRRVHPSGPPSVR